MLCRHLSKYECPLEENQLIISSNIIKDVLYVLTSYKTYKIFELFISFYLCLLFILRTLLKRG